MNSYIPIALVGLSHKTAPVEIRERVAFSEEEQKEAIKILTNTFDIEGCMILSTCNRTEVYICGEESFSQLSRIRTWLDEYKRTPHFQNPELTYAYQDEEAVLHFYKVAAGLDSLVIGEPQITGQVKDAYKIAFDLKSTNTLLNKLYNFALQAEKKVRTDTFLTDGAVSVSFAGVELARKVYSKLENKKVLLVGAGETAELAAVHFREKGVHSFKIVNRTVSKAEELARSFSGKAFPLDQLAEAIEDVDIVISATASKDYVINKSLIESVIKKRYLRPLFLIDLAIPRDIDPDIDSFDGIYLYNIDDLEEIVKTNLEKRNHEIPKAMRILHEYLEEFKKWMSTHSVASTINRLKKYFDDLRQSELNRLKNRLPENGISEIEYLTQSLLNKVMHQHIKSLKRSATDPKQYQQHVDFVNSLYELDQE